MAIPVFRYGGGITTGTLAISGSTFSASSSDITGMRTPPDWISCRCAETSFRSRPVTMQPDSSKLLAAAIKIRRAMLEGHDYCAAAPRATRPGGRVEERRRSARSSMPAGGATGEGFRRHSAEITRATILDEAICQSGRGPAPSAPRAMGIGGDRGVFGLSRFYCPRAIVGIGVETSCPFWRKGFSA